MTQPYDYKWNPTLDASPLERQEPTHYCIDWDLFDENTSDRQRNEAFAVMGLTPQHTYQVLTKRPERMLEYFSDWSERTISLIKAMASFSGKGTTAHFAETEMIIPLPNVLLGVTCENQRTADERIPLLLQTPAAVRFLRCEPLLEDIDLRLITGSDVEPKDFIHWVIVGGGARPCDIGWIRSIVEQCKEAEVPCFVERLGGNPEEWPEDLRVREYPKTLQPT